MGFFSGHFYHHGRFYAAIVIGAIVYVVLTAVGGPMPLAAACDAFFASYLLQSFVMLGRLTRTHLVTRAQTGDEGAFLVVAIELLAVVVTAVGVFMALNHSPRPGPLQLFLVLAAAPLGWFVLHTITAFHYANLHYFDPDQMGNGNALQFPGTPEPELSDFIYFSFVIGMTAQVSDVQVCTPEMRRAVAGHSIISFFFNTVLIAMAVNAALANAN
ncbi:MAG: DUF1345 domain-containing protein [Alphaproteobacteria bacterium]|nr:DUF1345 domain-containing protein [Alphaproteobacteria bacterium]